MEIHFGAVQRILFSAAAGLVAAGNIAASDFALADDTLTFVSWGGAYTRSQMLSYVIPYEQQHNVRLDVKKYDGGLKEIRSQVNAYNVTWDVVDVDLGDAIRGCQEGLLEKIDHAQLPPAPDGTLAEQDFLPGTLPECAVGEVVWSTVVAYDTKRISGDPPRSVADFFDLAKYPGERGLRKTPKVNLEWALMADGVPVDQVYAVLATEDGVQRAFDTLESIRHQLVWWEAGDEPAQLLARGEVIMTSGFNGRIYDAIENKGQDVTILWDGQAWDYDLLAVPKRTVRTPSLETAMDFVKFATATPQLAEQAKYISYGPARRSSMALIGDAIKPHLPTAPENAENALRVDAQWWADHQADLDARFSRWLAKKPFMGWYQR